MLSKKNYLAFFLCLNFISLPVFAEDDDGDCATNEKYAEKRAECDALGSDYMFRHIYTDGCDCIKVETGMVNDLPAVGNEGESGGGTGGTSEEEGGGTPLGGEE